ncbi:MAG: sensor histidine kinase [Clostridia bacterium]|nr:sensor histidine kinase [Clostridia bacterium]
MKQIEFKVSAKAARLIGRENISDVDGAMVELIKNAYDADADCVFVKFDMPFPNIPNKVDIKMLEENFNQKELKEILKYYNKDKQKCTRKSNLENEDILKLQELFFKKNRIIIIDNGTGMTEKIINTSWMNIGTSDKEKNAYSKKGRIKTGAKGIGRFALEKLSLNTEVYTKSANDELIYWNIDWRQFDNKELLNEIKATIDKRDEKYGNIVKEIAQEEFKLIQKEKWDTGTIIILNPTREAWTERLFKKVNLNMQSINPLGSSDKFDVWIRNSNNPELNFHTEGLEINKSEYDYRIKANFDGNNINVTLERNEVDIDKNIGSIIVENKEYKLDIDEFWNREAFKNNNYRREQYNKEIKTTLNLEDILKDEDIEKAKGLGSFALDLYFLKSGNSDFDIIKKIKVSNRKKLLNKFSGVKLYRDNFKVRPYGDEGPMYDWLNLGGRSASSPAGVSHPKGKWRVEPYQLIGCINIGRFQNKNLTDMANREQLALNESYYIFVDLIQKILEVFEYDRQYIYREYGLWIKQKEEKISKKNSIIKSVINEKEKKTNAEEYDREYDREYTKEDYKDTVYNMAKESEEELKTAQILMSFSSAGIITNTFSHEIGRISTEVGSRTQQLEACLNYIFGERGYIGDNDFNPYIVLNEMRNTDHLLDSWISTIMNSVQQGNFKRTNIRLEDFLNKIEKIWEPLMDKKYITLHHSTNNEDCYINISEVDLYLIFNNFYLNSAWFLEKVKDNVRNINITIDAQKDKTEIILENNGPALDEKYKSNPDKIFEAGETSKEDNKGTGLGLWICKEVVNRNFGEIHTINEEEGFKIKISLPN